MIFFFGIKLPNRVALNHPINEAATKTLTFSVILFELPSEQCACGHEFIGFAEPMSPLRFMHAHSYLLLDKLLHEVSTIETQVAQTMYVPSPECQPPEHENAVAGCAGVDKTNADKP